MGTDFYGWDFGYLLRQLREIRRRRKAPAITDSSFFTKLSHEDLRKALEKVGIRPVDTREKPLVFLAGFGGHIARKLELAGYNVVFSDLQEAWVKRYTRRQKLRRGVVADAESLPFDPKKVTAFVSYQPFNFSFADHLEKLSAPEKGFVMLDFHEPKNDFSRKFQERLRCRAAAPPAFSHPLKLAEVPIEGSRTIEGNRLALFHVTRKNAGGR